MLAILTTHPIQYQVPIWRALAKDGRVPFEVWYFTDHGTRPNWDPEFGRSFAWDIDTLGGYPYRFLNVRKGATPNGPWNCFLMEPLRQRLRKNNVRALWIQGWQVLGYWQAVIEARAAGVELWLRGESNDLAPQPWWKRGLRDLKLNWLFRRADRIFYIGSHNRRLYERFKVSPEHMYSAPYAVDNDRFAKQADAIRPNRDQLRRQWGIPQNAFCILFCGKFIPKKRPMDLVAAAQQLRRTGALANLHLLFVGSGALGAELRRSCEVVFDSESFTTPSLTERCSDSSRPRASFAGFLNQTEISQAYVAADILALLSDYGETWGLVVNEALASNLPCLVSDACGCAEDLAGGISSFELGNIPMLASKLLYVDRSGSEAMRPPSIEEGVSAVVRAYRDAVTRPYGDCKAQFSSRERGNRSGKYAK